MLKPFLTREAGATFSRKNRGIITQALALLRTALRDAGIGDEDETEDDKKPVASKESGTNAAIIEAAGFSMADIATLLDTALRNGTPKDAPYDVQPQLADVYDDFFVYREGWRGPFYRVPFTIDESGAITLGVPELVVRKVQYVAPMAPMPVNASEAASDIEIAADVVELCERAVRADGTTKIKIIAPGVGSSGFYPADVLRRDGPRVFKAGTQMFWDHDTPSEERERPEGTLQRLAAVLKTDAAYEENGPKGAGLYAEALVHSPYRESVDELAPYIGTSIRASGKARVADVNGRRMPVIEEITEGKSIDFVTKPGAGGAIVQLFEAARTKHTGATASDGDITIIESNRTHEGDQTMTPEEIAKIAADAATAAVREAVAPLQAQIAAQRDANDLREAETAVARYLANIDGLPRVARDRLAPEIAREFKRTDSGAIDIAALTESARQRVIVEMRYLRESGARGVPAGFGDSTAIREGASGGAGDGNADDDFAADMTAFYTSIGMSESAAKIAARGRA